MKNFGNFRLRYIREMSKAEEASQKKAGRKLTKREVEEEIAKIEKQMKEAAKMLESGRLFYASPEPRRAPSVTLHPSLAVRPRRSGHAIQQRPSVFYYTHVSPICQGILHFQKAASEFDKSQHFFYNKQVSPNQSGQVRTEGTRCCIKRRPAHFPLAHS